MQYNDSIIIKEEIKRKNACIYWNRVWALQLKQKNLSQKFETISILHYFCQTTDLQKRNIHFVNLAVRAVLRAHYGNECF